MDDPPSVPARALIYNASVSLGWQRGLRDRNAVDHQRDIVDGSVKLIRYRAGRPIIIMEPRGYLIPTRRIGPWITVSVDGNP